MAAETASTSSEPNKLSSLAAMRKTKTNEIEQDKNLSMNSEASKDAQKSGKSSTKGTEKSDVSPNKDGGGHVKNKASDKNKGKDHSHSSSKGQTSSGRSSKHSSRHNSQSENTSELTKSLLEINEKLAILSKGLAHVTPIVTELKTAYDNSVDFEVEGDNDDCQMTVDDDMQATTSQDYDLSDGEIHEEPPSKRSRIDTSGPTDVNNGLDSLAKLANKPQLDGPEIDKGLADGVKDLLELGMEQTVKNDKLEKIMRPSNCKRLDVVRINQGVFNNLSKNAKTDDVLLQKIQKPILKGLTVLVNLKNDLATSKVKTSDLGSVLDDAIALIADGSHELDLRRRSLLKDQLKPEFRAPASETNPVTELLFGDDLEKTVDDMKKSNKVTNTLSGNKRKFLNSNSYTGHSSTPPFNNPNGRKRFPFLGQSRRSNHYPHRGSYSQQHQQQNQRFRSNPQPKGRGKGHQQYTH